MKWVAVCPECGVKESTNMPFTAEAAKVWADCWLKKHWEKCSERKA